jgi:DNA polymerase family A
VSHPFCVDNKVLGTDAHLIVNDGTFAWSKKVPRVVAHFSGEVKEDTEHCLDTALLLGGVSLDHSPPDRFVKAMSHFSGSLGTDPIPWSKVMPAQAHRDFTKRLIGEIEVAIAAAPMNYYSDTWVHGNAIFRALKPAAIDERSWNALVRADEGNVPAIKSFEPGDGGFANPVKYDRFNTLTGRLTVKSGPQILTLKREHRSIIKSAHGDRGTIVALDFAALEARVLLYEYGRKCDDVDLYGMIAKEIGQDRNAIKGAVISELYGSSKWALGKHLGIEGRALNEFVNKVKAYFNTQELLERVKAQFVATGKVINRYGRPVPIDDPLDHVMISYYAQSSGVDVTMMGFEQVIEQLAKKAPRTRPIFLLHDALILDAHNDELGEVAGIKHVKVSGYVQKFPLRYERLS